MSGLALLFTSPHGVIGRDDASFLLAMLLGALAFFASTFSMISAVASGAANTAP